MKYQVSVEGSTSRQNHVQFCFQDTDRYEPALKLAAQLAKSVKENKAVLGVEIEADENVSHITLLFNDRERALKDGVPASKIEQLHSRLFRYKIYSL